MINRKTGIPLYLQIRDNLIRQIEEGRLKPGDRIPPEPELEAQYNVSRITIRRAIDDLVEKGILRREQGRGTFVQRVRVTEHLENAGSWTELMKAQGFTPSTRRLVITRTRPPREISASLCLFPDEEVIVVQRLRCLDGDPICHMKNFVRLNQAAGLLEEGLMGESLHKTLETRYGIVFTRAEDVVEVSMADEEDAGILGVRLHSPLLHLRRVWYSTNDVPVEVSSAKFLPDRYQYKTVTLVR